MLRGEFRCGRCHAPLTPALRELTDLSQLNETEDRAPHVPQGYYLRALGENDYWTAAIGTGNYLLHLADLSGTRPHPDPVRQQGCCGPSGDFGPNLLCAGCGHEIGMEHADCYMPHFAELLPTAVVLTTTSGA